jgi:hypothetical protein
MFTHTLVIHNNVYTLSHSNILNATLPPPNFLIYTALKFGMSSEVFLRGSGA